MASGNRKIKPSIIRYVLALGLIVVLIILLLSIFTRQKSPYFNQSILLSMLNDELRKPSMNKSLIAPKYDNSKEFKLIKNGYFFNYYYNPNLTDKSLDFLNSKVAESLVSFGLVQVCNELKSLYPGTSSLMSSKDYFNKVSNIKHQLKSKLNKQDNSYFEVGAKLFEINYSLNNPDYKVDTEELQQLNVKDKDVKIIFDTFIRYGSSKKAEIESSIKVFFH